MERQDWYLATLGVVRYVPRGSVVVVEAEPVPAMAPAADAHAHTKLSPPVSEGRAALRQLVEEVPTPSASVATAKPAMATSESVIIPEPAIAPPVADGVAPQPSRDRKQAQAKVEEIEFRLAVWQPAPDLLFFDSLAPGDPPSAAMARLVANMAAALGRPTDGVGTPQLIDWPPSGGRSSGGLEAARAMASAFCDARLPAGPIRLALIMGRDAARLLLPGDVDFPVALAHTRGWRDLDAVVTESLTDLLGDVASKRRVWRAIAPFVHH